MSNLREHARWLHNLGANVNAIQRGTKKPLHKWKDLHGRRQELAELDAYDWRSAGGIGINNGPGGWHTFDIDAIKDAVGVASIVDDAAIDGLLNALGLPHDYPWVWRGRSKAGWALAFLCDDPLPAGVLPAKKDEAGVAWGWPAEGADWHHLELRYAQCQTVYPPSAGYAWRHNPPTEAPTSVPIHRVIGAFFALCPPAPHTLGSIDRATVDQIRHNFDMVSYATRHFGGDTQVEGDEVRVMGHGGMLINPAKGTWHCFGDEIGGDPIDMVAYKNFRTTARNLNGKSPQVLAEAAEWAGVTMPERKPTQTVDGTPPAAQKSPADPVPFRIFRGDAIDQVTAPRQLIKGYLSIGTVALLIGPSEAGKSTIAVDIANKVAQHYGVLYIAGEDGANVRSQIRAWELLHNKPRSANLALVDGPVLLNDDTQVATFISAAREMAPRLIVIDTLSSCIPGVDENSSDVGHVTYNLNRIADELGAVVLVLHHPLKYDGETFRGHSSLLNNTHTMLVAARDDGDDTVTLKVIRHKGTRAAPTTLRLVVRATDIVDPDDGVLSAPVALPANRVLLDDNHLSTRQLVILQWLDDLDADGGATSSEIAREFAAKFKTTEGVIRKDIASLVRRKLMTPGQKRNDPRVISTEGRARIAADRTDHTDHSTPNDPFVINARLDQMTTIGDGTIHDAETDESHQGALDVLNDPNDPQRSVNDPLFADHSPNPQIANDPYDPVFSTGSYGSFAEVGGGRTEEQKQLSCNHESCRRAGYTTCGRKPPTVVDTGEYEDLPADLPSLPLRRVAEDEPLEVWDGDVPEDEELTDPF